MGAALKLMQLDGGVFKEINLSCADELQSVTRKAIPAVTEIQDGLGRAWHQLGAHPGGAGDKIRPCLSYMWEYAKQVAAFYQVIEKSAGTMVEFERWLASAGPAGGPRRPGAASPALWPLSLSAAPRGRVVEALEFLEKTKTETRLSSYILSEIQPWEQMLIGVRDLMTGDPDRDVIPSVLIPRQVWVRYCFPFAVQDDEGKRADRLLHVRPEAPQHPLSIRLREELTAQMGPGPMKIGEPAELAETEFFQVGTSAAGRFGGIRIDLPDLMFVRDFLAGVGPRPYRAWLDLNQMGNFCLCVEAVEPLKDIPPPRLYRALRAGTPFVFGEPVTLAPQEGDGEAGQPPQWDNLHTFARGMIRAAADAYFFRTREQAREASADSEHYVRTNPHEVVIVQTDAPIDVQSEVIASKLDGAVGGRILLRSLQRAAGTLEEWTRFPPVQRAEQRARASALVAVPEVGYAGDWFVHTGETTVFGIVAVPGWFRNLYPEAAQFASSWSPVLQLWNRRLQSAIKDLREAASGAASKELRNIEQEVRRHLAEIHAEDLCATLAYRRFLDGLLDAVGIGRLQKELEAQLQAGEQLTDYFYQYEEHLHLQAEKLHQQKENEAARRRDILLFFIALLGVFSLADFLALVDSTGYQPKIGPIRLTAHGQLQDVLVLVLFGLALVGGIAVLSGDRSKNWLSRVFALFGDRPGNWLRKISESRKHKGERTRSAALKMSVTIEKLDYRDDAAVADFYQTVLRPNFSADELETQDGLVAGMRAGRAYALVARSAEGVIIGGTVGDWFADSRVVLASYLAVPDEFRGNGIGGRLLSAARSTWLEELAPLLVVGEVEDPRYHQDTGFGNPFRRVALYESSGIRSLPVPYFQPALRPGASRVPHLLLMVSGGTAAQPGTGRVDGAVVERFLTEYFELCEGPPRDDDPEYHAMLEHCRQPGGLPLVLIRDLPPLSPAT